MSYLRYNGIDVQMSDITSVDLDYCRQLLENVTLTQLFLLRELISTNSVNELTALLEANTDFNPGLYGNTSIPRLPKTPSGPKEPANSNLGSASGTPALNNDQKLLNDLLRDNQAQVVSSSGSTTKIKMPDGSVQDVQTNQLDPDTVKDNASVQAGNKPNPANKNSNMSYILNQFKAGKTPGGKFATAGDNKGVTSSLVRAASNMAASALRDSVEPEDDVLEEMGEIVRLAGINGKNENCAGSKAQMPSIIGNTSDSHRPTVKLGHELRKERVAKERMKDNKFKKE